MVEREGNMRNSSEGELKKELEREKEKGEKNEGENDSLFGFWEETQKTN